MKEPVICYVQLFDAKQRVIVPGGEVIETSMDELAQTLVNACEYADTRNVHLFGHKDFCKNKICAEIKNYSTKKIRVEIN